MEGERKKERERGREEMAWTCSDPWTPAEGHMLMTTAPLGDNILKHSFFHSPWFFLLPLQPLLIKTWRHAKSKTLPTQTHPHTHTHTHTHTRMKLLVLRDFSTLSHSIEGKNQPTYEFLSLAKGHKIWINKQRRGLKGRWLEGWIWKRTPSSAPQPCRAVVEGRGWWPKMK